MRSLALALLASLPPLAPVVAQASSIDPFLGEWRGEGALFGAPFEGEIAFESALDDAFLRLRFESRMDQGSGLRPVMSAEAFYAVAGDGTVTGRWFDTRGVEMALAGTLDGPTLEVTWTAPDEVGRTTYTVLDDGRMEVVDRVRDNDGWREFGRATYRPAGSHERPDPLARIGPPER